MAGPRVQVQYQGRGEQTQAVAAENIRPIRARFDPNDSGAYQLAKAFGALPVEQLGQQASNIAAAHATEDRKAAEAYANSLTVDELGKRIKDGKMLPSQSPTFVAALQHIYGENTQAAFERDTLSKMQTGELRFNSPEEMDKYLTEHRNEALTGADKYTVAGYDKGYGTFREKALNANTQIINQQTVERGIQEASDNLGNEVLRVTQAGFQGDPAQALVDRYQLLRKTSLLRDDAAKEALAGMLTSVATSGNQALTAGILDKKLDNGITVRAVLGDVKVASLLQHAEAQNDKSQRQRVDVELRPFYEQSRKGELDEAKLEEWAKTNERWVTTATLIGLTSSNQAAREQALRNLEKQRIEAAVTASEHGARQAVATAIAQNALPFLQQQQVLTTNGDMKNFDTKAAAQEIIADNVKRAGLSVEQATQHWATNNVENPEWQKEIQAGASNIASVGWSYDGKNIGQLNPQGQKAIETFMRINATHPAYAEKLTGSSKDYRMLSDIQFLMERGGFPNVSDAAALVNQANRSGIERGDYGTMSASVKSAVDDVVNPGFWSGKVSWFQGLFGNDQTNLTSVSADIRRRAELLVMSGQVPDAAAAVQATVQYLANPAVTTRINNTLYFNKDLPSVPKGEDVGVLMGRFIKEVPEKLARDQQMSGDVRLEPNQSGGFTAWIGGVPLVDTSGQVKTYRKEEISQWIDGAVKGDRMNAIAEKNFSLWQKRVRDEFVKGLPKDSLPGRGQAVLSVLTARSTYDRFLKDGHANKPVKELKDIWTNQYQQGK